MKELVVISGKGGTGKTSLVAALAVLAEPLVLVDCDVDAADLHLVVRSSVIRSEEFVGGSEASIRGDVCTGCGQCVAACRFDAIADCENGRDGKSPFFRVDPLACEGCGVCVDVCPAAAIDFVPKVSGRWLLSQARGGPLVHARMAVGAENSGKLVTHLRRIGRDVATAEGLKENVSMRIAIPVAGGRLCPHFGHCEHFALVEVAESDGASPRTTAVTPPPHEPGLLPSWLHDQGVTTVIAGGIGQRAQQFLAEHGIAVVVGAPRHTPEELVSAFLSGNLQTGGNTCDH